MNILKKYKLLIVTIISFIFIIIILLLSFNTEDKEILISNNNSQKIINSNFLTMMYETDADSGEYQVVSDTTWPQEGYTFNETLSKCENGSILTWDDENKKVLMHANGSDKCYVYFDKELEDLIIESYSLSLSSDYNNNYLLDVITNKEVEIGKYILKLSNGETLTTPQTGYSVWEYCRPMEVGGSYFNSDTTYSYIFYVETVTGEKSKEVIGELHTDAIGGVTCGPTSAESTKIEFVPISNQNYIITGFDHNGYDYGISSDKVKIFQGDDFSEILDYPELEYVAEDIFTARENLADYIFDDIDNYLSSNGYELTSEEMRLYDLFYIYILDDNLNQSLPISFKIKVNTYPENPVILFQYNYDDVEFRIFEYGELIYSRNAIDVTIDVTTYYDSLGFAIFKPIN